MESLSIILLVAIALVSIAVVGYLVYAHMNKKKSKKKHNKKHRKGSDSDSDGNSDGNSDSDSDGYSDDDDGSNDNTCPDVIGIEYVMHKDDNVNKILADLQELTDESVKDRCSFKWVDKLTLVLGDHISKKETIQICRDMDQFTNGLDVSDFNDNKKIYNKVVSILKRIDHIACHDGSFDIHALKRFIEHLQESICNHNNHK